MDLSKLDTKTNSDKGVWFSPMGPTGQKLDCEFLVLGRDSTEYAKYSDERMHEAQDEILGRKNKDGVKKERSEDQLAKFTARLIKDWKGVEWEEKELKFSNENAVMVFSHVPFIREQVDAFILRRDGFFPEAVKASEQLSENS